MGSAGFQKSGTQCREEIENIKKLKGEYKKIKDNNKPTNTNRKSGKFYMKFLVISQPQNLRL